MIREILQEDLRSAQRVQRPEERESLYQVIEQMDAKIVELIRLLEPDLGIHGCKPHIDDLMELRRKLPFKTVLVVTPTKCPIRIGLNIDIVYRKDANVRIA